MIAVGTNLGSYVVVRALSSGGMSDALLARSPAGRLVVLKTPRTNDAELAARLRDEARLGSRIYHAQLVETLDAFEHDGMPVVVLGYVEGPTLDEMRRQYALMPACAARIGCHVAEALGAIHDARGDDGGPLRALHRDVTARNIVVTPAGDAVLIDLGIARFDEVRSARTETGMVLGTLRYMAPEIVDGEAATVAADFYSLGCVIIEACTGQPVFTGPPSTITANIVTVGPLPPAVMAAVPPPLRDVVARMVARQPRDRPASAEEISSALRAAEAALGGGQAALATRARSFVPTPAPAAIVQARGAQVGVVDAATTGTEKAPLVCMPAPAPMAPQVSHAPQPLMRSFAPPSPLGGASLELAVEPRARSKVIEVPKDPRDWYPAKKRDWSFIGDGAQKIIIAVVLLGGGLLAWRWYDDERRADDQRAIEQKVGEETELLRKALADTPADCGSEGAFWLYQDRKGAPVIVDSIGKIPKQYRAEARCVTSVR